MHEHIAFRVELGRLLDSLHGFDLRQHFMQQSGFIEQKKSLTRLALDQHFAELIAYTLARNLMNLRRQFANRLKCFGLDHIAETRRKADSTQHPQLVLSEPSFGIINGSNDSCVEVFSSADVIQNLARERV